MLSRVETWWTTATFGSARPASRVATLAWLGLVTGLAEAAAVILIVAIAAGGAARLPLDEVLPDTTWGLVAAALAVLAALAISHYLAARVAAAAAADSQTRVQRRLVDGFLDASWSQQAASPPGELQELAGPKAMLLSHGTHQAAQMVSSALNLAVLAVAAVLVSPFTAVGLLVAVMLVVLMARPFRGRRKRVATEMSRASTGLAQDLTETAALARDLRVFGVAGAARERLTNAIDAGGRLAEALRVSATATGPLTRDATLVLVVLSLALIIEGSDVSLATLGTSVILVLRTLGLAQSVATGLHLLDERAANVAAITDRLSAWLPEADTGSAACPPIERVRVADVSYSYPAGGSRALDGVSLELVRGEQVGVVGPTGSGKSTLAGVILGIVRPDCGQVLVGETSLAAIDPAAWSRRVAWVGQEPRLLTGSVADNIRFLRADLSDDAVQRAAERAGLTSELAAWVDGTDHRVGPAGSKLSGGQRQRIALARALAGDPELLVLDEPTSAQDPHSEAAVREALVSLRDRAIVVVIAHRLSTIRACDRIVVVDRGRLVALAPPSELSGESRWFDEAVAHSETGL